MPRSSSALTPARLVALVLCAVIAAVLAYVRFAPEDGSVGVPAGAEAGDLRLQPCTYQTEDGPLKADCGTLVVPENRDDPRSRLIALPVTRLRALAETSAEPVFLLWGGPGITNLDWPQASRFVGARDVVLIGYRGVDGSVRLDCPEVASALKHSTGFLDEESFRAYADGFRTCAQRLRSDGVDLAGYGLPQQADDLEAARIALGYDRIDLLSESAGTRLALVYAWRHPQSIYRSVMVGVNPPGYFLWDPQITDEQVARYAALCAEDESCSRRTDDLAATMRRTAADLPDSWFLLPIDRGSNKIIAFMGMMESTTSGAPISAPMIFDAWLTGADGDASAFWLASLLAKVLLPEMFVWGEYASVGIADAGAGRDYFAATGRERSVNFGRAATTFTWGNGKLAEAWPAAPGADDYSQVRTSDVETLLIGGALDLSTPPQVFRNELLPMLPNAKAVELPGFGHTATFWSEQQDAGKRLINGFFASGRVDDSLYTSQTVDFTPGLTLPALAKIVAGIMVGLALVTVLSLLVMARRIRKRGRYGPKASALLRSVYVPLVGLGGWFLGVLIVLTTMPGVPLDSVPLAVLSVGVPVGLGVYLAWVRREWSAGTRNTGLALAAAGALLGAWLGAQATAGMLAVFTAVAGAAVGANLALLALDIRWDRSNHDRLVTLLPSPGPAPDSVALSLHVPRSRIGDGDRTDHDTGPRSPRR